MHTPRPTRRELLAAALAAGSAQPVRAAAYTGSIIDTHVHFYDPTRTGGVPWPSKSDALLYRRFLPAEFREATKGLGISGVVVVEASPWLEDNQWVLDLAKDDPLIVGVVGHLDPGTSDFRAHLARFRKHPLFRGIRIGAAGVAKALAEPAYFKDLAAVAEADLQLDVIGGASMLDAVLRLSDRLPGLRIVIDHLPLDSPVPKDFAGRRTVYAKVSGVLRKQGDHVPDTLDVYRPALDELWSTFGPERVVYASNWPVSNRLAPYATVLKVVREYFESKGDVAAGRYFAGNAAQAYRLRP